MVGVLATETVTVITPGARSTDPHGNPVAGEPTREEVAGVLPQPTSTADVGEERPDGVTVAVTFHWPRTDHRSLRGRTVEWEGRAYRVIGDPVPYVAANCPGAFDRSVQCEACDG